MLIDRLKQTNTILQKYLNSLTEAGLHNVENNYMLLMKTLLKTLRVGVDSTVLEKIKLVLKDPSISEDSYKAIGTLSVPIIQKAIVPAKKMPKGKSTTSIIFQPNFSDKVAICPSLNERVRMLVVNYHYEKIFRNNVVECINLINRFDDPEKFKNTLDELSEKINKIYIESLQKTYCIENFTYSLEDLNMTSNSK